MLALALDTSSPAILTAVIELGPTGAPRLLASRDAVDGRRHGELLAPAIAAVLAEAGVAVGDLTAVVAGIGPGPFTGLRVGLVTAASFADAAVIPAYGVCSLDAIAASAVSAVSTVSTVSTVGGPVLVATDARRKEVYWARYDAGGTRTAGPSVDKPADVDTGGVAAVVGAGGDLYPDIAGGLVPLSGPAYPDLTALVTLAADRIRAQAPSEVLTPLYLRRPDAVPPAGLVTS